MSERVSGPVMSVYVASQVLTRTEIHEMQRRTGLASRLCRPSPNTRKALQMSDSALRDRLISNKADPVPTSHSHHQLDADNTSEAGVFKQTVNDTLRTH